MRTGCFYDLTDIHIITVWFGAADVALYLGIIVVIMYLGRQYKHANQTTLSTDLLYTSSIYIYVPLIIITVTLMQNYDVLSLYDIVIFNGSYTFSMFSQVLKIIMLVILGSLYILFPTVLSTKMRVLELPVLLQICAALCATIISSTNFALLLLALEGFSLTLYIMTALGRNYGGVTASVKYFAFGTLGSIFLF
jgi:NADH:ubiquinone oxidoreductase subunit 2 (subunit N)